MPTTTNMPAITIEPASLDDAAAILALQKLAFQSEARIYDDWNIAPLRQSLESLREEFARALVLKALLAGELVGSVRASLAGTVCAIGGLIVHPDRQRLGIGSRLLSRIEDSFGQVSKYELFTGSRSEANLRLYHHHGYTVARTQVLSPNLSLTFLEKTGPRSPQPPAGW